MENLCMQYLVVSFLKWVATSCGMWGSLTYLSTPSFAAKFPRVDLRVAVVHQVHRVQVAHRDRSAAVDPLVLIPEADLDPKEALAPQDKAVAQGAADTLDPVDPPAAAAPPARAAHRVALVPVAALVRPGVAAPRAAQGPQDHLAHRELRDPLARAAVHRVDPVVLVRQVRVVHLAAARRGVDPLAVAHRAPNLPGAVVRAAAVRKVDQEVSPDRDLNPARSRDRNQAPNPDRSQVRKAAANHQAPDHQDPVVAALDPAVPAPAASHQAEATAADPVRADRDLAPDQAALLVQVQAASAPVVSAPVASAQAVSAQAVSAQAVSVPVALAVQGNRMARVAIAVARRAAAAALVQPVVAAARVTTSGTGLAGWPLMCRTHASFGSARFRRYAFARGMSRPALARMSDKPFTQDASKVRYDQTY